MATYGLTLNGIVIPTISDIRTEIETALKNQFGQSLPLGDTTLLGFIVGIVSERLALLWQFAQGAWSSLDPDAATGIGLEALSLITGTFRLAAASSTVIETFCGTNGTSVPAGTVVATTSSGVRFGTVFTAVCATLPSWVTLTAYTVGQQVTNSSICWQCIIAGTSSSGPVSPAAAGTTKTDGGVTWIALGPGTACVNTAMASLDIGPIVASANDLNVIATPISGITNAINVLDAALGRFVESDQNLRLDRTDELSGDGASTADAIRAKLLQVANVTSATVFYNTTDATDGNGLSPHSILALVEGGAVQDIVNVLFANVVAGTATLGTTSGTATDSQGVSHTINFTVPTQVPIYIRLTLSYDATVYVGDAALATAIVAAGNNRPLGADAIVSAIIAACFSVAGPIDVSKVYIFTDVIAAPVAWVTATPYVATPGSRSVVTNDGGRAYICTTGGTSSGGPTGTGAGITDGTCVWQSLGTTISIDNFHLATYDTGHVTITSTPGSL